MFDSMLIDRFFIDVGEGQGSSPGHIVLDHLGARVVAGLLNMDVKDLKWRYDMNEARLPYLEHLVKINQVYIYLLRKARSTGAEVLGFRTENHVRKDFTYQGKRTTFNPDAYGQYWKGNEGIHFFLELDNGTMTPKTFEKKHGRYAAYYASGEYLKEYETFPLILTVTTTEERANQLRKVILARDKTDLQWLFTTEDQVRRDPLVGWLGKEETPVSLF